MLLAAAAEADKLNLDISIGTWGILAGVIVVMLAFDLFVYARGHIPSVRENSLWSIGWIGVALAFGAVFWAWQGSEAGSQYLAGYLLERSLSLDNLFVFAVILSYFAVPGEKVQGKVLAWGIMLALGLRLIFIMIGAALLDAFHITFYAFGALLLYTAWKLARHDDTEIEPEHNPLLKQLRKRVTITDDYDGDKLFTKANGKRVATPLLAVFVVIASTDILFAVDSIPAIFAVTQESFIVFAANAFALIGLRALYFLLVGLMDRFVYLTQGLSVILAFIGVKMLLIDIWHVPIWLSLAVIAGTLGADRVAVDAGGAEEAHSGIAICTCSCVHGWPAATWNRRAARFITTDATVTVWSAQGSVGSTWRQTPFGCDSWLRSASSSGWLRTTSRRGIVLGDSSGVVSCPRRGGYEEVVGVGADGAADDVRAARVELDAGDVVRASATVTAELALVFAAVRSSTASSTLRQRLERLPQEEVDRGAVEPAVRRRVEHVQADAEAGVVEADLGQDARLGERREPAVLVLDDPDDGRWPRRPDASPSSGRAARPRRSPSTPSGPGRRGSRCGR